jgi:hypothetical protein
MGQGRIANRLAERGARVTGLDATALFLDRARHDAAPRATSTTSKATCVCCGHRLRPRRCSHHADVTSRGRRRGPDDRGHPQAPEAAELRHNLD